jgi:hypothetical protein
VTDSLPSPSTLRQLPDRVEVNDLDSGPACVSYLALRQTDIFPFFSWSAAVRAMPAEFTNTLPAPDVFFRDTTELLFAAW